MYPKALSTGYPEFPQNQREISLWPLPESTLTKELITSHTEDSLKEGTVHCFCNGKKAMKSVSWDLEI